MKWLVEDKNYISYKHALSYMQKQINDIRFNNGSNLIWLLEHNSLYTVGAGIDIIQNNLPFAVHKTRRGGKYTYHGPGQQVCYIMLNLNKLNKDIRIFINFIETWIIHCLAKLNIQAYCDRNKIGIWVEHQGQEKKIASIGIQLKSWITMHGFALNINTDLEHFNNIIPCGLKDCIMTSVNELGVNITMQKAREIIINTFTTTFKQFYNIEKT